MDKKFYLNIDSQKFELRWNNDYLFEIRISNKWVPIDSLISDKLLKDTSKLKTQIYDQLKSIINKELGI